MGGVSGATALVVVASTFGFAQAGGLVAAGVGAGGAAVATGTGVAAGAVEVPCGIPLVEPTEWVLACSVWPPLVAVVCSVLILILGCGGVVCVTGGGVWGGGVGGGVG